MPARDWPTAKASSIRWCGCKRGSARTWAQFRRRCGRRSTAWRTRRQRSSSRSRAKWFRRNRAMHQAAVGFAESTQQLTAFLAEGLNPVTQRLMQLDQTFQSLEQAVAAIRDLSAARPDIEHLTHSLAQAATIADAISNLPEQVRGILEESAPAPRPTNRPPQAALGFPPGSAAGSNGRQGRRIALRPDALVGWSEPNRPSQRPRKAPRIRFSACGRSADSGPTAAEPARWHPARRNGCPGPAGRCTRRSLPELPPRGYSPPEARWTFARIIGNRCV